MTGVLVIAAALIVIAFLAYRDSGARADAKLYRAERDRIQTRLDRLDATHTELEHRVAVTIGQLNLIRQTTTDPDAKILLRRAGDVLRSGEAPEQLEGN